MKTALIPLLALTLAACTQSEPDNNVGPAATTTPPESRKPDRFETSPLVVDANSVVTQEKGILAGAAWTAKQCALTTPDDGDQLVAEESGNQTRLAGYFIAPDDRPAGAFDIVLSGESVDYKVPSRTGWDRSDVAEFFKAPELASSGFDLNVDLGSLPSGEYKVDFLLDRDGTKFFCESGKRLVIE